MVDRQERPFPCSAHQVSNRLDRIRCQAQSKLATKKKKTNARRMWSRNLSMPKPRDVMSMTILEFRGKNKTNSECAVPATSTKSHAIDAYAKATDSVLVASQNTDTLSFQCIPHIAGPIVITAK